MNRDIFLMPLGGGQRVGASCYYLRLGDNNILLDAGSRMMQGSGLKRELYLNRICILCSHPLLSRA